MNLKHDVLASLRRSSSLERSDARVYEPQIRARLGTTAVGVQAAAREGGGYRGDSLIRNHPPPKTTIGP